MNVASLIAKRKLKVTGIIHVGGHYAEEDQLYLRAGVDKRMYFEPVYENFAELKKRVQPGAILHNVALGSENKTGEMFIESANQGESCSLLEPLEHLKQYPNITFDSRQIVDVCRLDSFETTGFNFLVLDVQGYELEVLKGAIHALDHIDYVLSEVNFVEMYRGCVLFAELSEWLAVRGLKFKQKEMCTENWGEAFYSR